MSIRTVQRNLAPQDGGGNGGESHDDDLPDDIKAILGIIDDSDQDSDDDKPKGKEKPDTTGKKFRTRDGKEFDTLEAKEAYIDGRDKTVNVKLRSAASLRRKSLEDGTPDDAGKGLKKIDLSTIDPEEKPKEFRDAVLHNEKVRDQEVAAIRRKMEDTEQTAEEKETRKEMRTLARIEAKKRGLKLREEAIDEFLDEAERSETTTQSVNALMKLLDTAQKSATAKDDDEGKRGKGDDEDEESGSLRVPGGGQGGLNKQDTMLKATMKMEELINSGKFDELPILTQINLTRAANGDKPLKSL